MGLGVHADDPSPRLEAAFLRIARERMAGLPLLNPALRVQAVGFERWQGHWLGALVTPWFLNLVLLPGDAASWRSAADGARLFRRFGAGDFAFLGGCEPEVGEFQSCSLCSPMADFADQASAVETARLALQMLHVEPPKPATGPGAAAADPESAPPKQSRRVILFGHRTPACRSA
jgi:[NiFe] hydrogenase assembly HybE family chaperone